MGFLSALFGGKKDAEPSQAKEVAPISYADADITLYAPVTGTIMPIAEVPDVVISECVMGDGVAIISESESVVAPCDGVISRLLPTKNAFAIKMESGQEVYVTFGVETMDLRGEGFTSHVAVGDEVKKGQEILQVDYRVISTKIKSATTSMIVIKNNNIDKVVASTGKAQLSTTPVLWVTLKHE